MLELICKRSIFRYKSKRVKPGKILAVLKADRWVPSWQNLQPWPFLVILAKGKIKRDMSTNKMLFGAPVSILILGNMKRFKMDAAAGKIWEQFPPRFSDQDICHYLHSKLTSLKLCSQEAVVARILEQIFYVVSFMALEVAYQGLEVCILRGMGNILGPKSVSYETVKDELCFPLNYELLVLLTLWYPAEESEQRSRRPFLETAFWNRFGRPWE